LPEYEERLEICYLYSDFLVGGICKQCHAVFDEILTRVKNDGNWLGKGYSMHTWPTCYSPGTKSTKT